MGTKKGKKLRVVEVEGPLKHERIEIRITTDGLFFADYACDIHQAHTQDELLATLKQEVAKVQATTYSRHILVDYDKQYRGSWYGGGTRPPETITGFTFTFEVLDVSDRAAGETAQRRLVYRVEEDDAGELKRASTHPSERYWSGKREVSIPFTDERYQRMKIIKEAVQKLALQLDEILATDADKLIEALEGNRLLPGMVD